MIPVSQKEELEIKSRELDFSILHIIVIFFSILLAARLWFLQIYTGEELQRFSNMNRLKKQTLTAPRGFILDREGQILVKNKTAVQLKINLNYIENLKKTLKKLAPIIKEDARQIEQRIQIQKKKIGPYHPIVIKESLNWREIYQLKLLQWDISGISVEEGFVRTYPLKENGGQILGFTGQIGEKQFNKKIKRHSVSIYREQVIGKSGMEKAYDKYLQGKNGVSFVEVDALNRISVKSTSQIDFLNRKPKQGQSISLNLSKALQKAAFAAFNRKDLIGPRKGAVIVMKTNGEILAWVSSPGFNPNFFSFRLNPLSWSDFLVQSKKGFINKGLQEHYAPGSTFKPFVALAALQEGIITKDTIKDSTPLFYLGRYAFHDSSPKGHGKINVITALEKSANTFFYKTGLDLGIKNLAKYSHWFGFGRKTGIDLAGEQFGWSLKKNLNSRKWFPGDVVNLSIGQGYFLTTLLQLAIAYNAIATEGLIVQPFLLREIAGKKQGKPKILDTLTDRIKRKHFKTVKEGLRRVVQGDRGTARYWRLKEGSYSGKTGTAQVISLATNKVHRSCRLLPLKQRHHGWFIAFAPSENPKIVVAVLTEHSCAGSSGSAPVARDIIRAYYNETLPHSKTSQLQFPKELQ